MHANNFMSLRGKELTVKSQLDNKRDKSLTNREKTGINFYCALEKKRHDYENHIAWL